MRESFEAFKGCLFLSLSQVSILNQHYHFKHDRSKRNLQQALLLQERHRDRGDPSDSQPHADPDRASPGAVCCHQRRSVTRDVYTAPGLTEKTFLLCHEIPPAALSSVTAPLWCHSAPLCHPSRGEWMLSKGQQVTGTATFSQNAPCSPCQACLSATPSREGKSSGGVTPTPTSRPRTQSQHTPKTLRKIFQITMAGMWGWTGTTLGTQRPCWAAEAGQAAHRTGFRHIKAEGQQD